MGEGVQRFIDFLIIRVQLFQMIVGHVVFDPAHLIEELESQNTGKRNGGSHQGLGPFVKIKRCV